MGAFGNIWAMLTGSQQREIKLLQDATKDALAGLDEKTQKAIIQERTKTEQAIARLEADIGVLHTSMEILSRLLLFEGSKSPLGDIHDIFSHAKKGNAKTAETIKRYCLVYVRESKERGKNAVDLADAFENRKKTIDLLLTTYNDLIQREGYLTQALRSTQARRDQIIKSFLEKIPDSDKRVELSAKYSKALSPVIAMGKENNALVLDIQSTIEPAIEKVKLLKAENRDFDDYKSGAQMLIKKADIKCVQEARELEQLEHILTEIFNINRNLSETQEKLSKWRDAVVPLIAQATTHLERDRELVLRMRIDYHKMQNELIQTISLIKEQLNLMGRKTGAAAIIEKDFDKLIEEATYISKKYSAMEFAIKNNQDTLADNELRILTYKNVQGFQKNLMLLEEKLKIQIQRGIAKHGPNPNFEVLMTFINKMVKVRDKIEQPYQFFSWHFNIFKYYEVSHGIILWTVTYGTDGEKSKKYEREKFIQYNSIASTFFNDVRTELQGNKKQILNIVATI